jgi:hypothetical protein
MPERIVKVQVKHGPIDPRSSGISIPQKPGISFSATHGIQREARFGSYEERKNNYLPWIEANQVSTDNFFHVYTVEEINARLDEVRNRSDSGLDSVRAVNESQGVEINRNNEKITEVESKLTSLIKSEINNIIEAMHQLSATEISEQLSAAINSITNKAIDEKLKPIKSKLDEIANKINAQ